MARDLNQALLIGRLVRDPEIRYTPSGVPVVKFSIANNVSYTQNNERKEYINYFDINVWGNQAISCEKYLKKGKQVAVQGALRQNRWQDKTSGQKRSKVEITASSVQFLSASSNYTNIDNQGNQGNPQNTQRNYNNSSQSNQGMVQDPWADQDNTSYHEDMNDEDIPF